MSYLTRALLAILFFLRISSTKAQGSIQLYLDSDCTNPDGPLVSISVGFCLPGNQSLGVEAFSLPSCSNGRPFLAISDRDGCQRPSVLPLVESGNIKECLSFVTGIGIASTGFSCVGDVTTVSQDASSNSVTSSLPTVVYTTSMVPVISTSPSPEQPALGQNSPSTGGLSISDRIALGVGIGIGIPTLVVAAWACMHNMLREDVPGRLRLDEGDGLPPPYELHERRR